MFWVRRQEDKTFLHRTVAGVPEVNLLLVPSCAQLRFVNFVPRYFNCATFSKELLALKLEIICPTFFS